MVMGARTVCCVCSEKHKHDTEYACADIQSFSAKYIEWNRLLVRSAQFLRKMQETTHILRAHCPAC